MDTNKAKEIVSASVQQAVEYCGSQMRLAKKAELSQGAIGKYIRKESLPTGVSAKKLAKAVNNTLTEYDFAPHIFDKVPVIQEKCQAA